MVLVLGLMVFTMAMFMFERIRADVTALVVLVVLGLTGLVPASDHVLRLLRQRRDQHHRHHDPRRRARSHRRAQPPRLWLLRARRGEEER